MLEDYYFDTSIWLDLFEKRGENGVYAYRLLVKIIGEDSVVYYSNMVMKELKYLGYSYKEIHLAFNLIPPCKLGKIHIFLDEKEEANKIAKSRKIPFGDAIHAILCRDNNLQLISRDKDFEKTKDLTTAKKPEEII
ncbi:hypothetical protein COV11_00255 [Candidatus Woesearchaeota archaeon CG10_big_fil_rev_8_21_14_0_10_30_7]|nr:MAG: hypothetical protein COV11_00255 [Candidatus Woesearchaeota archaeon CG10_big_fil_rev_8_21_14_0_10_30_7]